MLISCKFLKMMAVWWAIIFTNSELISKSSNSYYYYYYNWKFKKCPIAVMMKNITYKVDLLVCWLYDRGSSYKSLFPVLGADMTIKNHHWSLPSTWVLQGCGWTLGLYSSISLLHWVTLGAIWSVQRKNGLSAKMEIKRKPVIVSPELSPENTYSFGV